MGWVPAARRRSLCRYYLALDTSHTLGHVSCCETDGALSANAFDNLVIQCEKQCEITWAASLTPVDGEMTMHMHGKNTLILWDMSGSDEARPLWGQHLEDQNFATLIFVIDSSRKDDLEM